MTPQEKAQIEREIRAQIVKRMRARLGFAWHFAVYALANLAMVAINLRFSPNTLWFVWPLGAWTVGLLLHAFAIFGGQGVSEAEIQAQVQQEMARRGLV